MAQAQRQDWQVKNGSGEHQALRQRLERVEKELSRLQRFDPQAAGMREHQAFQDLLMELTIATAHVQDAVRQHDDEGQDMNKVLQRYHRQNRSGREQEVHEHDKFAQRLLRADQVITKRCTCGKHHGITFIEEGETLLENVCPINWWITQSRVAHNTGSLSSFRTTYPFAEYVGAYLLDQGV